MIKKNGGFARAIRRLEGQSLRPIQEVETGDTVRVLGWSNTRDQMGSPSERYRLTGATFVVQRVNQERGSVRIGEAYSASWFVFEDLELVQ